MLDIFKVKMVNVTNLFQALVNGSRMALSRSITLVESTDLARRPEVGQLMNLVYQYNQENASKRNTFRLGISGPPGAGKSTFIDAMASFLLNRDQKLRISVLTVDPSSPQTGGSLLADSLRMEAICQFPDPDRIFVRSTPSGGHLGGVHRRTPYAIQLSEACGYDFTMVETVGTGQSEVEVAGMVDCFVVLIPPAAGDDVQAIKKGIIEMADLVAVTKDDPVFAEPHKRTYRDYLSAMKLFPPKANGWKPVVARISSRTGRGIGELWEQLEKYQAVAKASGFFHQNRCSQFEKLYHSEIERQLLEIVFNNPKFARMAEELQYKVATGKMWPASAARMFVAEVFPKTALGNC